MKILVTGGTGVIGVATVSELLHRGHEVRLLSRHADEDAKRWTSVESFNGNVADATSLFGAATGCDAVVHIAGIASERPPELTFERVNVAGTRHVLAEAERANARRFVYISSLGADSGSSDYHRSKFEAETLVERSPLDWIILRPGNVYGPGDEVISLLMKMVRALPAVPIIDFGDQPFQPIWHEDLGSAIGALLEGERTREVLELAGNETTSMNDILDRLREITQSHPLRIPVASSLASIASKLGSLFGVEIPIDDTKLTMLREENVIRGTNALPLLGITATTLDSGLRRLADDMPEVLPEDGVGRLHRKRFHADITGTTHTAESLMTLFRDRIQELMPIDFAAEPEVPERIEAGATMTGALPLRGNFQVRVEVAEPTRVVLATIEGHPLAGIVQFTTASIANGVRFAIDIFTRASNVLDLLAIRTVGQPLQDANWRRVVQNVVDASGGTSADGVKQESETLSDEDAKPIENAIREMVQKRQAAEE